MYKLSSVFKSFDKEKSYVLNDINLSINDGDFIAITGESGAGKTTLINILGTIDRITRGFYTYDNINLENLSDNELAEFRSEHIGIVFQDYNLILDYTVEQNILLPKLFTKDKQSDYKNIVKKLKIDKLLNKKAKYLSGGEQQRVAMARAMINQPNLILADEPTGNLDAKNSNQLFQMLKDLNEQGITVITVTHSDEFASKFQTILKIEDGRIIKIK